MASRSSPSNPLALPVLALLRQRPMHPYEMATEIRRRHWHGSVKLTHGTLYAVVDSLARAGFVAPQQISRDGRRPERTTYAITDHGRTELFDRLRDLLGCPDKEYTRFAAGLTLVAILPRAEVVALLEERGHRLAAEISTDRADLDAHRAAGLPRMLSLDAEHALVLREAELAWVRDLAAGFNGGGVRWPTVGSDGGRPCPPAGADREPCPADRGPGGTGGGTS